MIELDNLQGLHFSTRRQARRNKRRLSYLCPDITGRVICWLLSAFVVAAGLFVAAPYIARLLK